MKFNRLLLTSLIATSVMPLFASTETDNKIEDAAKASYNYRTVLEDKVSVKAREGVITLTGTLADKDLKALAEDTVVNLPGVMSVDNQITIDPAIKEHSDAWIAWKIRMQLLVRSNVSSRDTKVNVQDGAVVLTGTAANPAQKELTGLYAKEIDHVKTVRNEIVVLTNSPEGKSVADSVDDASITSQVKYALFSHKSTSALKTKIITNDGIVRITGEAASAAEKSLVSKLAESIRGVKSVNNDMTVKS